MVLQKRTPWHKQHRQNSSSSAGFFQQCERRTPRLSLQCHMIIRLPARRCDAAAHMVGKSRMGRWRNRCLEEDGVSILWRSRSATAAQSCFRGCVPQLPSMSFGWRGLYSAVSTRASFSLLSSTRITRPLAFTPTSN